MYSVGSSNPTNSDDPVPAARNCSPSYGLPGSGAVSEYVRPPPHEPAVEDRNEARDTRIEPRKTGHKPRRRCCAL